MFVGNRKYLVSGIVMLVPVFWLNTYMKASWLWILVEVAFGVVTYSFMVLLLKTPIISQAKYLLKEIKNKKTYI